MPPRDAPPLDARVQFRLTAPEKVHLAEQAAAAGMTPSAYCRARVLERKVIADVDMNMIRELRRQGGQLKKIHTESSGAYSAETAAALREITRAISALAR